jgi:hypothetical protein
MVLPTASPLASRDAVDRKGTLLLERTLWVRLYGVEDKAEAGNESRGSSAVKTVKGDIRPTLTFQKHTGAIPWPRGGQMEKVVTRAWPRMNCFQPDYALALRCALTAGERVALATLVSSCGLPRLRGPLHSRHALLRVPGGCSSKLTAILVAR